MSRQYCAYCGRVAHRCNCAAPDSRVQHLIERNTLLTQYQALWMPQPYQRGVPPQIKRRERNTLRRHYAAWFKQLTTTYGTACANCGQDESDKSLVIDHVVPIAKGGLSTYDNLQLLCAECNRIKGKLFFDCRPNLDA